MSTVGRRRAAPPAGRTARRTTSVARPGVHQARAAWVSRAGLVVSLGFVALFASGFFRVRTVLVVGDQLPMSAVIQTSGVSGQNIFAVRADRVIGRLSTLPSVQVIKVETSFPDTVTIYARSRPAVAAWQQGKVLALLDAAGTIVGQATTTTLPVVTGVRAPTPAQLIAIGFARRDLPKVPDGATTGFNIDARLGLQITGTSGWRASLGNGTAQAMVLRVETLAKILDQLPGRHQHLKDADLRYRNAVVHVVSP